MKNRPRSLMLAVLLPLAVLIATDVRGQTGVSAKHTTYSIRDLGTLGGGNSIPIWMTNSGEVVGYSETGKVDSSGSPIVHAFRWKGVMKDLGTLGGNNSQAFGANEEGVVAGIADVTGGSTSHAVVWDEGENTDLGTLIGPDGFSYAELVNDRHQVVGASTIADGSQHAVLWHRGVITDLGTQGGPNSFANGINERGQIVGGTQINSMIDPILGFPPFYPVLWDEGTVIHLGSGSAAAFNINNRTQVVGRSLVPVSDPAIRAVAHAFLWESGVIHDLGVPAGEQDSEAISLNDRGEIVGDSGAGFIETYTPDRALLWRLGSNEDRNSDMNSLDGGERNAGDVGAAIDLNTLVPAGSGYHLIVAFDVNARGQIIVSAVQLSTGNIHAALLTPRRSNIDDSRAASALTVFNAAPRLSENAQRLLEVARRRKSGHGVEKH
jgi:probable HAF family extracellular repeat protein